MDPISEKVIYFEDRLKNGENKILGLPNPTGIGLSILRTDIGYKGKTSGETAFLLLSGDAVFSFTNKDTTKEISMKRDSLFDENPVTVLLPHDTEYEISPADFTEFVILKTESLNLDKPSIYLSNDVIVEKRGAGILDNTCFRLVKTVFDYNINPRSSMVLGEVVNFQGRWSSYPPHHHPQPEIYLYRFDPVEGYGFSQLGSNVVKVTNNSLVIIDSNRDHPQVSAPGYRMWYLWVVRHLDSNPYTGFEFDPKHKWIIEKEWRE